MKVKEVGAAEAPGGVEEEELAAPLSDMLSGGGNGAGTGDGGKGSR